MQAVDRAEHPTWDGGRLPSEAEWNYAAAGGQQQRAYPWSKPPTSTTITLQHASYGCEITTCVKDTTLTVPGAHLDSGGALWGHADMAGNVYDWLLDGRRLTDDNGAWIDKPYPSPCTNCVDMTDFNQNEDHRVIRGGGFFSNEEDLLNGARYSLPPGTIPIGTGIRCVRDF